MVELGHWGSDSDSEFIHQITIYYTLQNIDWWADQK